MGTEDGGRTWAGVPGITGVGPINGMFFSDSSNGIIVGNNGLIMRTGNGGLTGITTRINTLTPRTIHLYDCYPNPFNPSTTITYRVPRESFVSLSVYNSLGQSVQTLVSEKQTSGLHSAIFEGALSPSGVYLCRLSSGGSTATIKMLLIK